MPGTTRYSATFDRPYQEDEKKSSGMEPAARRSRSMSLQAQDRPYTPLGGGRAPPPPRSSSTDGESKGVESIPTRTVTKTVVKTHNNPFQFVKVGSSPLYRKAEEQLKKTKEVKKPDVLKEEEEEWQSNLDSWKSRRRKMSEDVFRRQEEIRKSEIEEQFMQANNNQKKIKTFSEMVESRATRGRALSLCLISSPLDLQKWELENGNTSNSSHPFSEGSEENSAFNSEDEGVSDKHPNDSSNCSNGNGSHVAKNGTSNGVKRKSNNLLETSNSSPHKDGIYVDSGLESISSSHRAGDTPDSCSDFSQDSGSSIDCDSPRVSGLMLNEMNVLDFNSKLLNSSDNSDSFLKMKGTNSSNCSDDTMNMDGASVANGELTNGACVNSNDFHEKVDSSSSSSLSSNGEYHISSNAMNCSTPLKLERSVESENEVFVDDFEELKASTKTFSQNNQESSVEIKALQTCNESTDLPKPLKTCIDVSTLEKSLISTTPSSEEKKLDEFKKEVTESGFHSEILKVEPVVQKEPKRKTVKKKKLKAKASVETCIEKSQPLLVQAANSPVSNLSEESLNIVFQSKSLNQDSQPDSKKELKRSSSNSKEIILNDVLPVEQVAEEMEKLILQQLEEEERAKEMSSKMLSTNVIGSPDHNLIAPPKVSEPPKEKPPPPPSAEADIPKPTSLKRINSTKRIKKEIHKRRSNFLGIENMDDNLGFDESSVPPPLALEEILKAEMELDRESMKRLEDAATERIKMEEIEIFEKEREIIETLETEEREKNLMNNEELCEIMLEEDRIQKLKGERMRMENERTVNETQRLRLEEEKLLKEREEYIRKQEVNNASTEISTPLLSEVANTPNISSPIASLSAETKANDSLSNTCGDGETIAKTSSLPLDSNKREVGKPEVPSKPVVPPKPLKKKEAIRKERERLRQEQEALQREREEHRQKLLLEQEEMLKTQPKSHAAPTTPVSRIGPVPPLKPTYSPQLTNPVSAPPRDKVSFPSQSFHGAPNGLSDSFVEQVPVVSKQTKPLPMHKKPVQKEPWMQQKVPSVKKQSHDPMSDSKYNQNHWLIQEAEMRRISELKERQQSTHFLNSQTHLSGDEVGSSSLAHPVMMPPATLPPPQLQENMWSYGHANPVKYPKKYSPPVAPEKPVGMYPPVPPNKPSRVVPLERQEQMLSVSGRKRCSHCSDELGRGAAMIIESLQLYYHIHCFQCCVCQAQLGNGSCGTDVRVRNNKLHCHNCYSNDEAGLKFSQV